MFEKFEQSHREAIQSIKSFLEHDKYENMCDLVKWLLITDANPYSFLPNHWANIAYGSAQGFSGLLMFIHHAVYDDGDISFVTVNGEPRIVFINKHDINPRNVLSESEQYSLNMKLQCWKPTYEIVALDIAPNDFGNVYNEWHANWIRQCFINDAEQFESAEEAAKHYRKYVCWKEAWIEEYKLT